MSLPMALKQSSIPNWMKRLSKDIIFNSNELSQNLAQKSARGGALTMTAQVGQFILGTAGTVILARLLTPNDYGLFGMVAAVVGFAQMFKDAGLSMATVQRDSISHEQISTLFWVNVLISIFLGICVLAASPLVTIFYGRPELTAVTASLSVSFIISGLMIQHQALLRRHMQFGTLAIIQIASQLIALLVTIALALFGWRYWALVAGAITTAMVGTTLTLFFCPWIPGSMKKGTGVRDMLKFGGNLTGFSFVNYFARNLDNILIGKFWGSQSLGLYSKAYALLTLPLQQINAPISAVAIPALSRLQNEPERYRRYYLKAIALITFITFPGVMFMIVMSEDIIHIVLGDQWLKAIPIFSILGFSALVAAVLNPTGWLYISSGRTDRMFKWGIFSSSFIVASFFIGLPYGAKGVAISYTIGQFFLTPFCLWYSCKTAPVRVRDIIKTLWPTTLATIVVGIVLFLLKYFQPALSGGTFGLAFGFGITVAVFLSVLCLCTWSFEPITENINLLKKVFTGKLEKNSITTTIHSGEVNSKIK